MKKLLSVMLAISTLAMSVPISASADTVQLKDLGYTVELLEATTDTEKIKDTRDPNSKLSDGVKKAISEGKENISVYLIFKYNAEEIRNEAEKRAEKEISELDQSEYNEKVIYAIKSKYLKEVNNEYINSILNEIGTDISQTQNKGWLTCTLDQEQINAAEANEKILGIFLDDPNYYLPLSDPLIYKETSESDKGDANNDEQVTITDVYAKIAGEYVVISDKMNDTVILLDSSGEFHIVYTNYKDTIINVTNGSELPINDLLEAAASESENSSDVNVPVIAKNSDTSYIMKAERQDFRNAITKLIASQNCVEKIIVHYAVYEDTANYYTTNLMLVRSDMSPKEIEEKYPSLGLIYDESNNNAAQSEGFDYAFNIDLSGISDRSQMYSELKEMLSDGCDFTFCGCMTELYSRPKTIYDAYEIIYDKASGILLGDENVQKFYTYNELMQMSDEEFLELYDYSEYYFGNDEVPDEIKFEKYLNQVPDFYIGDNYVSMEFSAYKKFKSGKCVPYLTLYVDRYTPLSEGLTADMLGYPAEWGITLHDGVWYPEMGIARQLHEYRIEVPVEIVSDFETFVRLEKSYKSIDNYDFFHENSFGIEAFSDIYQQFMLYGDNVSNLYGDANLDYKVNIADAVLVMQVATNPDKYAQGKSEFSITAQGEKNADVDGKAGLSNEDALLIQKYKLGLIDKF